MSERQLWQDNANASLESGITDSATSLTLKTGEGQIFPDPGADQFFVATLIRASDGAWELVKVTARSGDEFSTIERGYDGTTPISFNADDSVSLRISAKALANLAQKSADEAVAGTWDFAILPTLPGNPTSDLEAAPKQYVDDSSLANIVRYTNGVVADPTGRQTDPSQYVKPAGLKFTIVRACSGGGAGGGAAATTSGSASAGGGGAAGTTAFKKIAASALSDPEIVTIGAGGTGVVGATGNDGGSTSFGGHVTALGGKGGLATTAGASLSLVRGGFAQTHAGADVFTPGEAGGDGLRLGANVQSLVFGKAGNGGSSLFGRGGTASSANNGQVIGTNGTGHGYGGQGVSNGDDSGNGLSAIAGIDGGDGLCEVWEYF